MIGARQRRFLRTPAESAARGAPVGPCLSAVRIDTPIQSSLLARETWRTHVRKESVCPESTICRPEEFDRPPYADYLERQNRIDPAPTYAEAIRKANLARPLNPRASEVPVEAAGLVERAEEKPPYAGPSIGEVSPATGALPDVAATYQDVRTVVGPGGGLVDTLA